MLAICFNWLVNRLLPVFVVWFLVSAAPFIGIAEAEVSLPPVFSDRMILQQGMTLPVWGRASPGESISVSCSGRYAETRANSAGRWRVTLRPLSTSFEQMSLVVNGNNRIEIHDVIVGDVWICAGEGNMQMPLSESSRASEGLVLSDKAFRFFDGKKWSFCTPDTTAHFSAVGYFFGRDLRASTRLPIGIISCTSARSSITAWISRSGLSSTHSILTDKSQLSPLSGAATAAVGPSSLFQSLLVPVIPYAITGAIWYQGESDEGPAALQYRRMLPRLIRDWRSHWGEGPFPFYFVSLAGFGSVDGPAVELYENRVLGEKPFRSEGGGDLGGQGPKSFSSRRGWPWIREAIASTLSLPSTGMAVATDLGVQDECHPPDKLNVGRRLALLARHRVYGETLLDVGPTYREMKIEGNKIRVEFDSVGGGLTLGISPSQEGENTSLATGLRGFAVAGVDRKWFPAQGRIDGGGVLVSSDAVPLPVAVRYNWRGYPLGNLYNKEGLPAPPFRSDSDQPR